MKTAAVIGAGFGGLALAIRLQSAGIQTTLFEARDKPGGRAYVYEDAGFTFDAGPTVITDPTALDELFALSGRRLADYVELMPITPFYRLCWEDGYCFDYVDDQAELDRQIGAKSPGDVAGYQRFLAYSQALLEEGYLKLGAIPFLDASSMVRAAPALVRLQAWKSVYAKVAEFISDEQLRQAFSFHSLLVGGNPFATSSIYALIHALERRWGVWFPRGGTGALVQAMVRLFEDLGGQVRLNTPVAAIEAKGARASGLRLAGGERLAFDAVASNADVVHTYAKLLAAHPRGRARGAALARKRHSMSLFVIYFGLKRPHPQLAHHMVLFGPRYRELIAEIFKGPELSQDFSLYLHAPSRSDPSLAPPGQEAFYVLAPVPHLGAADLDWSTVGPAYRDKILAYLEERYIPNLTADLVTSRIFTPFDFREELNAHYGSAFSLEPILTQSAYFRAHNRDDVIRNLYIVGAGAHPGAGVPGVVGSAKATASLMLEDLMQEGRTQQTQAPQSWTPEGGGGAGMSDLVLASSRDSIRRGSASFAAAARLFDPRVREDAYMLYAWCRHCDDEIDGQVMGHGAVGLDAELAAAKLAELERKTRRALAGEAMSAPAFAAFQRVALRRWITPDHPLDLLQGFRMDVEGRTYRRLEDTLLYAYHVAGVVGVMMAQVMGVRDRDTLRRAADLGIALQLTNIARDVIEDAQGGRVYLPAEWLGPAVGTPAAVIDPANRAAVFAATDRLLTAAEPFYASARWGLKALDFRSAWAVAAAQGIYRQIGVSVRKAGGEGMAKRVVTGRAVKVIRALEGGLVAARAATLDRRRPEPQRPSGLWARF